MSVSRQLSTHHSALRTDFVWPVRVYYEDTDSGGVVYYANYLKFMERARTEWLRAHGFEQPDLLRDHSVIFVVRSVQIEYLRPAQFDELLHVTVELSSLGRSQIEVAQRIEYPQGHKYPEGQAKNGVLTQASVRLVCVNGQSFKPVAIPAAIKEKIERKS